MGGTDGTTHVNDIGWTGSVSCHRGISKVHWSNPAGGLEIRSSIGNFISQWARWIRHCLNYYIEIRQKRLGLVFADLNCVYFSGT